MKSNGLSSKFKKVIRHNTKAVAFATNQVNHFAAKEKVKQLQIQAEQSRLAQSKKDAESSASKV